MVALSDGEGWLAGWWIGRVVWLGGSVCHNMRPGARHSEQCKKAKALSMLAMSKPRSREPRRLVGGVAVSWRLLGALREHR